MTLFVPLRRRLVQDMIAIGFRASPQVVYFSVLEQPNDPDEPLTYGAPDRLVVPRALEGPELLRYVRTNVLDVLKLHDPAKAAIKTADYSGRASPSPDRLYLEGLIQEAVASSAVVSYVAGATPRLAPLLDLSGSEFKQHQEGTEAFLDVDEWEDWSKEERESFLAAAAALNLQ